MDAKQKRDDENEVLDEVIHIFIEKVSSMDDKLRDRVNTIAESNVEEGSGF